MLNNMKIGTKLLLIGGLLLAIPLVVASYVSVQKAGRGLKDAENELLAARSKEMARLVDRVILTDQNLTLLIAQDPALVRAAEAVASGRAAEGLAETVAAANASLARLAAARGLSGHSEALTAIGLDGRVFASSVAAGIGVSLAERDYFRAAAAGQVNTGAAVISKVSGKPIAPVAVPIYAGSPPRQVGVLANLLDIGFLTELVAGTKVGETGYAFVLDCSGLVLAHPDATLVFKLNPTQLEGTAAYAKKMVAGQSGVDRYVFQGVPKTCGYAPVALTGWSVGLTLADSEYLAPVNTLRDVAILVIAASIVAAMLIFILFVRSLTRPLAQAVGYAQAVAEGDFSRRLDSERQDEVGLFMNALNRISEKLGEMALKIRQAAEQVAGSSGEISASAQQLAEGAQSQASTLEETSASVEELTASVEQVSEHAQSQAASVEESSGNMTRMQSSVQQVGRTLQEVSATAAEALDKAQVGGEAVGKVVEAMQGIAASSERIVGIIGVIGDIADQTNLLALNAAIEAARAGEHGRGFAVVADEVGKLSDRSASSTREIGKLIQESGKSVAAGVEIAQRALAAMEAISTGAKKTNEQLAALAADISRQINAIQELGKASDSISEMSQSISAATEEQTTNAKQVSKAIENVNELTQQAASAAEEMSGATEELSGLAQGLLKLVAQFKLAEDGRVPDYRRSS